MVVLSVLALLFSLAALGVAGFLFWQARVGATPRDEAASEGLPTDVLGLRQEVAALRLDGANALRNVSVVRYDAFGDMGGALSWSAALLDDHGNGVVLTSIHGRNDARTYAKSVAGWASEHELSPEETDAIGRTRTR